MTQQQQQGQFNLSGLAACTYDTYSNPVVQDAIRLVNLRGAIVFLNHDSAGGLEHEVGSALTGGGVNMECYTIVFASETMPPVNLCIAALLSSIEGADKHACRRRPKF